MSDFNFNLPQELGSISVSTIASANTISPKTPFTIITGNTDIQTIVPPITGLHLLYFSFAGPSNPAFILGGNIVFPTGNPLSVQSLFIFALLFNPLTKRYSPLDVLAE